MTGRSHSVTGSSRLLAVDALRGFIIVLMALDHANYFIAQKHSPGEYWGGSFPIYSEALPFLTRLVTHLAAPGFFFLMGAGMALFKSKQTDEGQRRRRIMGHFWIRGGLLIAVQFLIVNQAWRMSPGGWGPTIYIGVLFALGGAMIICSLFLWWRSTYLLLLAAALFVATEILHPQPSLWNQIALNNAQLLLLHPGGDLRVWSNYPILPWLEVAFLGLAYGQALSRQPRRTYRRGLMLGLGMLAMFVLLRTLDGFGNIRPMPGSSWIDFLNVVKYPPSWTFTLLTMGTNLIVLWLFSRIADKHALVLKPLAVYGRAPLFFYVIHLFLYAALGMLLMPMGSSILAMLPFWLLGLAILYPLCMGYIRLKRTRPANRLLRYL